MDMTRRNALARRGFLRLFGQGAAALALAAGGGGLAGCGGGGSSRPRNPGTPGPTPTPGTGGPLTPETRASAIQAVNAQMVAFREAGNVSDQQVVDFLRSRPEFEDAGSVRPGGAWARFTDGELFIVSRNFAEPDPDKTGRAFGFTPESAAGATRAAGQELPQADRARIYNALGSAFTPPHDDIRLWMVRHGYLLASEREATIEALKTISGDGVFYINSHGDYCQTRDHQELWALWTADEVSPEKDLLYKDLLADGSLVRFSAIHDKAPIQNPFNDAIEGNPATHYAVTKRFIERFNWQFGPRSFVFVNCCWSADADFVGACLARGASAYAGWTNAANPAQAWRAARFVFDRLLGQLKGVNNEYPEPGGPQRPFELGPVVRDLRQRGWHQTQTSFGEGELIFGPNTGDFGLLSPSIKYVETDEMNKKLILHGKFGTDPGPGVRYVRVEGADLNVTKWENERIEADILPDQHGDVWVQIVARKSNVRQLTRWDGEMDYSATGPETLRLKAKIRFRFRADVGKFRNEPGGPLQDRQIGFLAVPDAVTTAHFAYSGEADLFGPDGENSFYTQWMGEGDIPSSGPPGVFPFLIVRGTLDTATRGLRMEVLPASIDTFKYRSYGKFRGKILGGMSDEAHPIMTDIADEMFDAKEGGFGGVPQQFLVMTCDGQWSVPAGERKAEAKPPTAIYIGFLDGEIKKIPTQLRWSTINAVKPPREDESRAYRPGR